MHLTQTRIATIDTYGVFFILCMYFLLYRYLTLPAGTSFRQGALPLFLSGLMWGLGAASKWTVIYAAVGLAVLYFMGFYQKLRDWPEEQRGERAVWCVKTLAFSVLCFVVIPLCIYCAAYLPYAMAKGDTSLKGLLSTVWENQKYMLHYHEGVNQSHPLFLPVVPVDRGRTSHPLLYGQHGPRLHHPLCGLLQPRGLLGGSGRCHPLRRAGLPPPLGKSRLCGGGLPLSAGALDVHRPHHLRIPLLPIHPLSDPGPLLPVQRPHGGRRGLEETGLRPYLPLGGTVALFYPVLIGLTIPTWYEPLVKWIESWPFSESVFMFLTDYHTHSLCSPDSSAPLPPWPRRRGTPALDELCLTDHCDLLSADGKLDLSFRWAPIEKQLALTPPVLRDPAHQNGAGAGRGLEDPAAAAKLAQPPGTGLVIGSVHNRGRASGGIDFYYVNYNSEETCYAALDDYFSCMEALAELDCYDVLGHVIYPLRYMNERDGNHVTLDRYWDRVREIFRHVIAKGKGIEVNTCRGRNIADWRPVLALYRDCGGTLITLGSDAHRPNDVGLGIRAAAELVKEMGFGSITVYERRQPRLIRL